MAEASPSESLPLKIKPKKGKISKEDLEKEYGPITHFLEVQKRPIEVVFENPGDAVLFYLKHDKEAVLVVIDEKPSKTSKQVIDLHFDDAQIRETVNNHLSTRRERLIAERLTEKIRNIIQLQDPEANIELFGSMRSGLHLRGDDFDLVVSFGKDGSLENLNKILQTKFPNLETEYVGNTRVPIIRCKHVKLGLSFDICCDEPVNPRWADLLASYLGIHENIKNFFLFLKIWAKSKNLIGKKGVMSSHMLSLLGLFYLQQPKPEGLGLPTIAELLLLDGEKYEGFPIECSSPENAQMEGLSISDLLKGFLQFHANFDFGLDSISVLLGQVVPRYSYSSSFKAILAALRPDLAKLGLPLLLPEHFKGVPVCAHEPLIWNRHARSPAMGNLAKFQKACGWKEDTKIVIPASYLVDVTGQEYQSEDEFLKQCGSAVADKFGKAFKSLLGVEVVNLSGLDKKEMILAVENQLKDVVEVKGSEESPVSLLYPGNESPEEAIDMKFSKLEGLLKVFFVQARVASFNSNYLKYRKEKWYKNVQEKKPCQPGCSSLAQFSSEYNDSLLGKFGKGNLLQRFFCMFNWQGRSSGQAGLTVDFLSACDDAAYLDTVKQLLPDVMSEFFYPFVAGCHCKQDCPLEK